MEEEKREVPSAETWAAMAEVEEMKKHPERYEKYHSFEELLQEAAETKAAIAAGEWPAFDTVDELSEALGL